MHENIHDNSAYHCPKSETTEKSIERSKANEIQDFYMTEECVPLKRNEQETNPSERIIFKN